MDKASSGLSPSLPQSSSAACTCVRVQFYQCWCWVSIDSDPCLRRTFEPGMQNPCRMMGGEKPLSAEALLHAKVGSNYVLLCNVFKRQSEGCSWEFCFFCNWQLTWKFLPCIKAVVTLLRPICRVNTSWVITVWQGGFSQSPACPWETGLRLVSVYHKHVTHQKFQK